MKTYIIPLILIMIMPFLSDCKKEEKEKKLPDISIIDISDETEWDYEVVGKEDYYFIKTNNSSPEVVLFHSSEANKDYSIFISENGTLSKVVVDDYIFVFDNFNGTKVDMGIIYPDGTIEIFREVDTEYDWGKSGLKGGHAVEAWSDIVRGAARVAAGVPCALSIVATIASHGALLPLALWKCGNFLLKLSADVIENDLEIHNGFTDFAEVYGGAYTTANCITGPTGVGCLSGVASGALHTLADHLEEMENSSEDVQVAESALGHGYGDVQITLTWDNTADLDLHVIDPNGEEIYWDHQYSASNGVLDVDDINGYGPENVYWPLNQAPNGTYSVYLHHYVWEDPGYPSSAKYTVLINAFDHIEKYAGTIYLDEVEHIADFDQDGPVLSSPAVKLNGTKIPKVLLLK
jgi:hypothetical protein